MDDSGLHGERPQTPPRNPAPPPPGPFTPRKTIQLTAADRDYQSKRSTSSHSDLELISGCLLIIRGVHSHSRSADPAAIVLKSILDIASKDPTLNASHVQALNPKPKYGTKDSEWSSTCYLQLADCLKPKDIFQDEPRTDILTMWLEALSARHREWEICWAPNIMGTDKRLWLRFPEVKPDSSSKADYQESTKEKLVEWARKHHYQVCSSFANKGGVVLSLSSPLHVDEAIKAGRVDLPGTKRESFKVVPGRQVEILNPFELAIVGLPEEIEPELLVPRLKGFIMCHSCDDEGDSTLVDHRFPENEPRIFVFYLSTLKATLKFLDNDMQKKFYDDFNDYKTMMAPTSVFHLNREGIYRKSSLREEFAKGAETMNAGMQEVIRRLGAVERTQTELREDMTGQFSVLNANFAALSGTVQQIQQVGIQNQQSMIILSRENQLSRDLSNIQQLKYKAESKLLFSNDFENQEGLERLKEHIAKLEQKEEEIEQEIKASGRSFEALLGGTVPLRPIISSPPTTDSAQATPQGHLTGVVMNERTQRGHDDEMNMAVDEQARGKRRRAGSDEGEGRQTDWGGHQDASSSSKSGVDGSMHSPYAHGAGMGVCHSKSSPSNRLTAAHNTSTVSTLKKSPLDVKWSRKGVAKFRGIFDTFKTVDCMSRPSFFRSRKAQVPSISSCNAYSIKLVSLAVVFLGLIQVASAMATSTATSTSHFTIYALNANGMVHPMKIAQFNSVIKARNPHAFVITETKTSSKLSNDLPHNEYEIFEESGQKADNHHIFKWGVIVGVRKKDVQVMQRLQISQNSLKGRAIAVDIALRTLDGHCFPHRLIGAYAPWNPGGGGNEGSFWNDISDLCLSTTSSWSLAGDLNATVASFERASGGSDARQLYVDFLQKSGGLDIWSEYPERSRLVDWTCRGGLQGGNIIDRVVTSADNLESTEISVADRFDDWICKTDHRAVVATMVYRAPDTSQAPCHRLPNDLRQRQAIRRIKIPGKSEKHKYQEFRDLVDSRIMHHETILLPVLDDESFTNRYKCLTEIIVKSAEQVFGRTKEYVPKSEQVISKKMQQLQSQLRLLGGAICLVKTDYRQNVSPDARRLHDSLLREFRSEPSDKPMSGNNSIATLSSPFLISLQRKRKLMHKELYAEKEAATMEKAKELDKRRIAHVLKSGSTKKLFAKSYIPLPMVVNNLDDPQKLVCDAEGVKATTREYFTRLYDHSSTPKMEKPWLSTPSIQEVRNRVEADPFVWPQEASLLDFRALIRRGNSRPSPGPDGWEKWVVKALSDNALQLVLDLHNYEVRTSSFPGDVKDMWLTMFHKRGLHTSLGNWRGLLLSNFIANTPLSWLNQLLIKYSAEKHILPDTQVATQPGVQTRDLMSFIGGVKCWAHRNKQTVYIAKRDQMKGFDYLSPEGFHDSIRATGLPEAIIALDRAAQTNTRCFIRTAYGTTEPIIVTGVTKQGGPLSPLKSTFTTGMGHYYLDDLVANDSDALRIQPMSGSKSAPHMQSSKLSITVNMVEATDDSHIFSLSLASLRKNILAMERFQYAYGWITAWNKSFAYVLNGPKDSPTAIKVESVTIKDGVDPMTIQEHEIPLIKDDVDFLRTKIDNPTARFEEMKELIDLFQFPRTIGRPPITLLRKVVAQNLISRIRALLMLQPIKQADAEILDNRIMEKVHDKLGFPFRPNTSIATLPVDKHGFGFPSVARINAGLAVAGLARDLNHHISTYQQMAQITLADWTCEKNNCVYPLDKHGLQRDFTHHYKSIPASWIVAQKTMKEMKPPLYLRRTDQTEIAKGEVSIAHVCNAYSDISSQEKCRLHGQALRSLKLKGMADLRDVAYWAVEKDGIINLRMKEITFDRTWSMSARQCWNKLSTILTQMDMSTLIDGPVELAISPQIRKHRAEHLLDALGYSSTLAPPSNQIASESEPHILWASDGSMVPASASVLEERSVIGAATGMKNVVVQVLGRAASILHGELMGIITALVLGQQPIKSGSRKAKTDSGRLLTDHLNSVRLIQDSRSAIGFDARLRHMNGRSYYKWIIDLIKRCPLKVEYTPGHSNEDTIEARMNAQADHYASSSQARVAWIPAAPVPTFFMDKHTFYRPQEGWIEGNISYFVDTHLTVQVSKSLEIGHKSRMLRAPYDLTAPPEYPYIRAVSAHSAAVQLYARSGQLATAQTLYDRGQLDSDQCRHGCNATEDMHHIFVECEKYASWRVSVAETLEERTGILVKGSGLQSEMEVSIKRAAKSLLSNDRLVWPLRYSYYYLGQIPKLSKWINRDTLTGGEIHRKKIIRQLASEWHTQCIRLAGRIFGDYQRRMAAANGKRRK